MVLAIGMLAGSSVHPNQAGQFADVLQCLSDTMHNQFPNDGDHAEHLPDSSRTDEHFMQNLFGDEYHSDTASVTAKESRTSDSQTTYLLGGPPAAAYGGLPLQSLAQHDMAMALTASRPPHAPPPAHRLSADGVSENFAGDDCKFNRCSFSS